MSGPPATARAAVEAMLAQVTREVAALPEGYVRQLAPIMAEARRELAGKLATWLREHPDGAERFTAQRYREALAQMDTALAVVRQRLPGEMLGLLGEQGDAAAALALKNLKKQIVLHAKHFGGESRVLPLRTAALVERGAALLMPRYRTTLERYGAEGVRLIQRQLAVGFMQGETFHELTRRLVKQGGGVMKEAWGADEAAQKIAGGFTNSLQERAARIVRTEGINTYNSLADQAIDDLEAEDAGWMKKWDAAQDRVCPVCRGLDGALVIPGGGFAAPPDEQGVVRTHRHPPAHPNCFLPDTRVGARVEAAMRSRYDGQAVEVKTASGLVLRVTANHPVATSAGFVAAATLREGDEVLRQRGEVWGDPTKVEEDHTPPRVDEVFGALAVTSPRFRSVLADNDLHGDARSCDGEVDVVLVDGHLLDDADVERAQQLGYVVLPPPDVEQVVHARAGARDLRGAGVGAAPASGPGRSELALDGGWVTSERSPLGRLRLGLPAHGHASALEPKTENAAVDAGLVGQLLERLAGDVALDEVVEVRHFHFAGHVYDLQTKTGWMVAQGIYVSNCRCALVAWRREWEKVLPPREKVAPKPKLVSVPPARPVVATKPAPAPAPKAPTPPPKLTVVPPPAAPPKLVPPAPPPVPAGPTPEQLQAEAQAAAKAELARQRAEEQRQKAEAAEQARRQAEADARAAAQKAEIEKAERAEAVRLAREKAAAEKAAAAEAAAKAKAAADAEAKAAAERLRLEQERAAALAKAEQDRVAAEERKRLADEKARLAAEAKAERERIAAEKARLAAEKARLAEAAKMKADAERLRAHLDAQRKAEQERKAAEAAKKAAEAAERARLAEEARLRAEAEARAKAEAERKAAEAAAKAAAKKAAALAAAEKKGALVKLPPPPPNPHTAAQRKGFNNEAIESIAPSRNFWERFDSMPQLANRLDTSIKKGFTYSSRQFYDIRSGFGRTLPPEQLEACVFYSHKGDRVLNNALRYGILDEDPRVKKIAENLDRAIASHKMPRDTHVVRGVGGEWAQVLGKKLKPGDTFTEPAYTSTSATKPFDGELVMKIKIPKGTRAAPIPTKYPDEDEFLLPRGSKFKVVGTREFTNEFGKTNYEMEIEVVNG